MNTSRLEGINKYFGTRILIIEETRKRTNGEFATRHLGQIIVKGREGAISVHELVASKTTLRDDDRDFIAAFEAAWKLYAAKDFGAALTAFKACLATRPTDKTTALHRSVRRAAADRRLDAGDRDARQVATATPVSCERVRRDVVVARRR